MANTRTASHGVFERVVERHRDSFYPALRSLNDDELSTIIDDFWEVYKEQLQDVVDLKTLKRGAFLARRPKDLRPKGPDDSSTTRTDQPSNNHLSSQDKILTNYEFEALDREKRGDLRSVTKSLFVTLATCSIGAIVQGWSQQSLVGANVSWPVDLHIATRGQDGSIIYNEPNGKRYFGLVNAVPYFAASILGAWVSDPLTENWGRRSALLLAGICSFAAPIGGAYCQTWYWLLICRIIQGIGMGAKSSVVPVLESEVSPSRLRGRLLVSWQTFVAVGIFLGASANCIFEGQWRHQFGIAFLPALPLLCLCYVIQESPRWLIKKRQYGKAYVALRDLRETPLQAARDLFLIHTQLQLEEKLFKRSTLSEEDYVATLKEQKNPSMNQAGFWKRLSQLFTIRRNRNAVVGSCVAMTAQQFSGFNVYAFLATTIFANGNIVGMRSLWFNFGFALTNAVFSGLTFFIINKLGRRTLLLWSLILMFPFLILTGHYLDFGNNASVITLVIVYTAIYSPGAGVIPFMYSSEVFPVVHRQAGMSLAVSVNFAFAGALAMAVSQYSKQTLQNRNQDLLGAFAGLDGLAAIMVWLFMRSPEEAMSLEEMNYLFLWPLTSYVNYQFKRLFWILGRSKNSRKTFLEWYETRHNKVIETRNDAESHNVAESRNGTESDNETESHDDVELASL